MKLNKVTESIGAINIPSIGIAGEVRYVITRIDGEVKTDTGYQKNLILNQGLDFFGGSKGAEINTYCAIGAGNSTPAVTQTALDVYIAQASGIDRTSDYSYVDKGDGLYRMWEQQKYRFTGLDNVNISEVGLVSTGTTSTTYYLTTRALIKDNLGAPTSISVKKGETLDVYYKIHKVVEIADKPYVISMLDGGTGSIAYNAVVRPAFVGTSNWKSALPIINTSSGTELSISNSEPSAINSAPEPRVSCGALGFFDYTIGSYTLKYNGYASLTDNVVGNIRTAVFFLNFMPVQVRFGSVLEDVGIPKTNNATLLIPMQISWGRYEGTL